MAIYQHLTRQRLVAFTLALPAAISASVIVYLRIGAEGPTWAGGILNGILLAIAVLNLSYFLFLWGRPRKHLFLAINATFSILLVLAFLAGVMSCFPGIGDRHGNCGTGYIYTVAFANFIVVFIANLHIWPTLLSAFLVAFPATTIALNIYITAPLFKELRTADLSATCYYQFKGSVYFRPPLKKGERLISPSDVEPGLFIGEHSPRIFKFEDGKVSRWLYTDRKFSAALPVSGQPEACE